MLVISRREGQRVQIGDGITITVVRVDPKSVRLGIDAPHDASIMRTELLVREDEMQKDSDASRTFLPGQERKPGNPGPQSPGHD